VLAVLSALALVVSVAGPVAAAKPTQFTTGLVIGPTTETEAPAAGSYNGGFLIPTTGVSDGSYVWMGIADTVANPDLTTLSGSAAVADGVNYPFYLKAGAGQQAALVAYLDQIKAEIAGTVPFFYLNRWPENPCNCNVNNGYETWDAFSYWLNRAGNISLRVDNDYPVGTYLYVAGSPVVLPAGTAAPAGTVPLRAQVKMKVYRG
jgi:hypothetical protein